MVFLERENCGLFFSPSYSVPPRICGSLRGFDDPRRPINQNLNALSAFRACAFCDRVSNFSGVIFALFCSPKVRIKWVETRVARASRAFMQAISNNLVRMRTALNSFYASENTVYIYRATNEIIITVVGLVSTTSHPSPQPLPFTRVCRRH